MADHAVLRGRVREIALITDALNAVQQRGAAIVVRGAAGVGKSALLDVAAVAADGRFHVLPARGTPSESDLPFAALHQLLRPTVRSAERLPMHDRAVLGAALGQTADASPSVYAVAMAALDVMAEIAVAEPVLILADDVQWMDRASQQVLSFVGRRLASDRIIVLAALRDTSTSPLLDAVDHILDVGALESDAAAEVLDRVAPELDPRLRAAVLAAAEGNPLALHELPRSLTLAGPDAGAGRWLPVTERLEKSFAARVDGLDVATRNALVIAALTDADAVSEVIEAAARLNGVRALDVLEPAVAAGLLHLTGSTFRFRHPLVRSAIYQRLTTEERCAGHAALAHVLGDEPDRRTWHRAAAALHRDDGIAADLEQAADRALRRGAAANAVHALEQSAQLSPSRPDQRRRIFRAATLAHELGQLETVARLRRSFRSLLDDDRDERHFEWLGELGRNNQGGERRIAALIDLAVQSCAAGDDRLAMQFLQSAAERTWNFFPDHPAGRDVIATAERLLPGAPDPWRASVLAYAAPFETAERVIHIVRRAVTARPDAPTSYLLGHAAACVGAFDLSESLFVDATEALRSEGRLHTLATALVLQAWSALRRGFWASAVSSAEEGGRLAEETHQPFWQACALAAHSTVSALRGDFAAAHDLASGAERVAAPHQFAAADAVILVARGTAATGAGEYERAFEHLVRLHDPTDVAYHPVHGLWSLGSMAEAAAMCGQRDRARSVVAGLRESVRTTRSPAGRMNLSFATAALASDDDAEAELRKVLATDLSLWPHERNRLLLALGASLRRRRRARDSRAFLRAARDGFDQLGARPWAVRAREELRAAGERSTDAPDDAWDDLSPQEMQIARMVAAGLSNREIGERLFLSHRTVGSHLYRMFPKLDITSRVELANLALDRLATSR